MSIANIGLTGLKSSTIDLEVTGNNVANANTVGYKQSRTEFADLYSSGTQGKQVGNGVEVSGVTQSFTQGGLSVTGNTLDMAINEDNKFFVLKGNNEATHYTRAGNFSIDINGFVSAPDGCNLQGYQVVNGELSSFIGNLEVPNDVLPPKATSSIALDLNLDANAPVIAAAFDPADTTTYNLSSSMFVYDSLGNPHTATSYYSKSSNDNWNVNVLIDNNNVGSGTLQFDGKGSMVATSELSALTFSPTNGATAPQSLSLDYNKSTQYTGTSVTRNYTVDGYPQGNPQGLSINTDGLLTVNYSNGQFQTVGKVALASFDSPQGLISTGSTSWIATDDSGAAKISEENSKHSIQSGALENSNVDLTEQLVKLISAQRAFQANAQTIKANDTITQAIINV
jgi:flagellar hook protein FlgE